MDEFLLEAMREVDALTPACPPIAPPRWDDGEYRPPWWSSMAAAQNASEEIRNALAAGTQNASQADLDARSRALADATQAAWNAIPSDPAYYALLASLSQDTKSAK